MQHQLFKIESQYADDLIAARAICEKPPPIHDEPPMIVASPDEKKVKESTEAVVMRSGPITLTADGVVGGGVAPGSPGGMAPPRASSGSQSAAASSGGQSAVVPVGGTNTGKKRKMPYDIGLDLGTSLPFPPIEKFGIKLFVAIAEQQLLASYIDMFGQIHCSITVQFVEASDPMMWRARAMENVPSEGVVLVPWASPLTRIVKDI